MKVYMFILYVLFVLIVGSVNIVTSTRNPYNRQLSSDRSFRSQQDQESIQSEYSPYDTPRFKKHRQSNNYRYRPSRAEEARENSEERVYFKSPNTENDPSIEVIVDPTKKKAVAVIENGPTGQATYDLTEYQNAKEYTSGSETDARSANQEQATNLDHRRSLNTFDSNSELDSNNYENDYTENEQLKTSQKKKRSMELKKRKLNKSSQVNNDKGYAKGEYTEKQVASNPMKGKSEDKEIVEENCPPQLEEKAKELKRNEEDEKSGTDNAEKNNAKREIANTFSKLQMNALTDSLAKVKDTGAEMDNLKHLLYNMGLVQNYQGTNKRDINNNNDDDDQAKLAEKMESANKILDSDKQQAKRELEEDETEDEDMNKDNIVMKRDDSQTSNEQPWMDDEDEQMNKRDADTEYAEENEEEEMVDEPLEKRENAKYNDETSELEQANIRDENFANDSQEFAQSENVEMAMRKKRQNNKNLQNQQENSGENQNEMIDNYEKELQQTNLELSARNKREQNRNLQSKVKDHIVTNDSPLESDQKKFDKTVHKRFDKDENKLIRDAENAYQLTSETSNADNSKKLIKRDNANDAKEKRMDPQEYGDNKQKLESEIKEKIKMIKEKVKREILEEKAERSKRVVRSVGESYYKTMDPNVQRIGRSVTDEFLDSEEPVKRSKRDVSTFEDASSNRNLQSHDIKQYVLKRREVNDENVTLANINSKQDHAMLPETNRKDLDPNFASQNLKTYIRERREVNGNKIQAGKAGETDNNGQMQTKETGNIFEPLLETSNQNVGEHIETEKLKANIRKRRDVIEDKLQKQQAINEPLLQANIKNTNEAKEKRIFRKKRTNGVPEKQMVYEPFQNEDTDVSEEEGEFGDNAKDGRLYLDKRQADSEEDGRYLQDLQKRDAEQYDMDERDSSYLNDDDNFDGRRRRSFEDEEAADNTELRGGRAMVSRRTALRKNRNEREKRGDGSEESLGGNGKLTAEEEYSENLYFGPLSQSYDGELTRYKRVKRDKP